MVHTCNSSIQEAEAGLRFLRSAWAKLCIKKTKQTNNKKKTHHYGK
jgi:hypothetical protein